MEPRNREVRDSSIELLRIIAMIGVILLHYNNPIIGGGLKYVEQGSINHYYLLLVENLFICAVNVFVMISGYFLCTTEKRKSIKIIELVTQVIVINVVVYLGINIWSGELISLKGMLAAMIPRNYYVILYSALYLISPYLNIVMKKLNKDSLQKFVILNFLLFSIYTILIDYVSKFGGISVEGLSTVGLSGSSSGYTIVNFVLIYMIGAYIRFSNILIKNKKIVFAMLFMMVVLYFMVMLEYKSGMGIGIAWSYNNPIVIVFAASCLLFFKQIKMKSRAINELSRGAFTCFLLHGTFLGYVGIEQIAKAALVKLILHQAIVAVVLYLVCYIVFKIYNLCIIRFIILLNPLCSKLDKILLINLEK